MAERAGTAQSVVARVEAGITDPGSETLNRLAAAAGYAIRCELVPKLIAMQRSEQLAYTAAAPLHLIYIVFKPLLFILERIWIGAPPPGSIVYLDSAIEED